MSAVRANIIAAILLLIAKAGFAQLAANVSLGPASQPLEETLEWMVVDSRTIVDANIEPGSAGEITFKVFETIKGDLKVGSVISVENKATLQLKRLTPGQRVLLFLQENRSAKSQQFPLRVRGGRAGFVLDGTEPAFLMDLTTVSGPQGIVAAAKRAAAYRSEAKDYVLLMCRDGLFVTPHLFPQDERLEALAGQWARSKSAENAVTAMRALESFKNDVNIGLAMEALNDTRSLVPRGLGKWQVGYYNVRAAADELLAKWKIFHPKLPESGPILIYQPLRVSRAVFISIAGALALLMIAMFIWRKSAVVGWAIGLSALLAIVGLSVLWRRSASQVDEVMFSTGQSHHEIASYRGGIQYFLMGEWQLQSDLVVGHFDLAAFADAWTTELLVPKPNSRLGGFIAQRVTGYGPGGAIHPITLLRVPYWALMMPFVLLLTRQSWIVLRQLRRRRLGLCRNCGYDLRENSNGTCPECGISMEMRAPAPATSQSAIIHEQIA